MIFIENLNFTSFKKKLVFLSLIISSVIFSNKVKAQSTILISDGGTVSVSTGDKFYDAGGPTGNDGNTDYTITLCPANPGEMVVLDFTYFKTHFNDLYSEEDALFIYDGPVATPGNDIGKLMGDYAVKYNTGVTPYAMGVEANGAFPLISTPTVFAATNPSGCLTLVFDNGYSGSSSQWAGWEANITTYMPLGAPGCNIDLTADSLSICSGSSVNLLAVGNVISAAINTDFNNSSVGSGWQTTSAATFTNNACSSSSLDGSIYLWMQNDACPRALITNAMDVSNGGTISFDYRQASNNGDPAPCEAPDQNGGTFEGVYVQYSTDGGTSWTTFKYVFPNATQGSFGAEGGLTGCGLYVTEWSRMTYPIPAAAQSANTTFRWVQSKCTSATKDNWGLDNVIISAPKVATLTITNLTSGATLVTTANDSAIVSVSPTATTTYEATITDGVTSCTDQITITVSPCTSTCSITALAAGTQTACNPATNTYNQEVVVTYSNPPGAGTLDVNGQSFAITSSPQTVILTNLPADGNAVDITAVFSADATCTLTSNNLFTAPVECTPTCTINVAAGNQTACVPATGQYTQEVVVTYSNEPGSGTIDINGQNFAITSSPQTVVLTGLTADGNNVNVTADFSADGACTVTANNLFTAPAACPPCPADIGNVNVVGGTLIAANEYDVCLDSSIVLTGVGFTLQPSVNPDYAFAVLSCPPTTADPRADPCFLGWDLGTVSTTVNTGTYPGNTFYVVPATIDNLGNTTATDFDGDGCFSIGTPITINFLNTTCTVPCTISIAAGTQTACDPTTNNYTQEIVVTYSNEPGSGTIDVNGQSFAITSSPQTVVLTGLTADGNNVNVTADFSADVACTVTTNNLFTAPAACNGCDADAGTISK
jgi:aerobic-type carbon monoxide dehydrogenase small subunit (CoxS/CutS family)